MSRDIFELLNNPPAYKIDRDFELEKEKIQTNKNAIYSGPNKSYRFVLNSKTKLIHDKDCLCIKDIPEENKVYLDDLETKYKLCGNCKRDFMLSYCASDKMEKKLLHRLFQKLGADVEEVYYYITKRNVKIKYISSDCLEVKSGKDTWRIKADEYAKHLLHNNYEIIEYERVFRDGFHEHRVWGNTFGKMMKQILDYGSDYHVNEIIKEEDDALETAPDNMEFEIEPEDIFNKPTMVKVKNRSLLYNRYIFIDTKDKFYKDAFSKYKIKRYRVINDVESSNYDYTVVFCDVPKWHRKKMFKVNNKIKSTMIKNNYKQGYLCGEGLIDILKKSEIEFTTWI